MLIPLGGGLSLLIKEEASPQSARDGEFRLIPGLPEGWQAIPSSRRLDALTPAGRPPVLYDPVATERGLHNLRIFELRDYYWELRGGQNGYHTVAEVTSSLEHSVDHALWLPQVSHGRFRFVNYLGSAWVEATVAGLPPVRISFEVASPKLDYEKEYRSMIETIGEECQQLLLEWGTPASLNLAVDPEKRTQTLLEQFLFLRHVLGPDKLDLYLETIIRHSHSRLERELEWKHSGTADPAFLAADPLRRGRDWQHFDGRVVPAKMQTERKFESADTPPNRFVKFALLQFRELCNSVLQAKRNGKQAFAPDDSVSLEATSMLRSLEALLARPLFDDVGELRRIPFESTTLQRSKGYREILLAWLMLDAAAHLDWPGREDAYDGTTRDVATLYEFWLYFLMVRAFRDRLGMVSEQDPLAKVDGALPFCCRAGDGRLVINLRQSEASFSRFRWENDGRALRVHFFYNRSFGRRGIGERGSYSKTFRPDYTLVIIPEEFDQPDWSAAERAAEKAGRIAYLHFDAKYRGENLPGLFGDAEKEEDEPEDRPSRATGTVKRVDLYKMHTYNEAIRRTVGSYVLYPGLPPQSGEAPRYERYHEVMPGIGAFALRPAKRGETPAGLDSVCEFISEILAHQLDRFTQSYRINTFTEDIIREEPLKYIRTDSIEEIVSLPGATAILGYMRKGDVHTFAADKFFYCRATDENGRPLSLDLSTTQGVILIGWSGPLTGPFVTVGWMARVISCRLVSREIVIQETSLEPSSGAVHYLLFKLADVSNFPPREITNLVFAANMDGEGGKFRTFESTFSEVCRQNLANTTSD
ncbi:DUF2357 domain-containing protein [Prosthecobacter sp. SYSU 5D2]|uniref:DUF2357 domain-containing protein n=1 Tax=Prosthecobacter sp. SYSU 5D2 TaxID=3134134 RepID=UPI0031FE4DBB